MGLAVPSVLAALAAVRCAGPALLLAIVLSLLGLKRPQSPPATPIISVTISQTTPRRSVILSLLTVAAAAYLFDGVLVVTRAVLNHTWEGSDPAWSGIEVADVLGLLAFGGLATTGAWKDAKGVPVWQNSRVKIFAAVALAFELVNVVLIAVARPFLSKPPVGIPENPPAPGVILAPFVHFSLAILRLIALSLLYPALTHPVTRYVPSSSLPAVANGNGASVENLETPVRENAGLLAAPQAPGRSYGTFLPPPSTTPSIHTVTPAPTELGLHVKPTPRKDTPEDLSWSQAFAKIRKLAPYLWPSKNRWLQFLAFLCMIVLLLGRVVNFVLPFTLKELVDTFDKGTVNQSNPWALLLLYVFLRFLQGSGGLGALRDTLWAPVMQYSDREMSQLSFDHLLNLSLAFHTRRKTGEILRILDRGAAINHIFELLLFNIIPTIIDITVALVAFFYFFGPLLCAVVFLVMVSYVAASVVLTRWRTKLRREMNDRDMVTRGIHTDCLLNYETVKYFGGEAHEAERYRKAIEEYQVLEYKVIGECFFY
ncbi:hypothetical protein FRC02_003211 [Tulasnella sp. 418]|nr:hypothetical protein FRC02_003211 [Tulasnella sp. 418]